MLIQGNSLNYFKFGLDKLIIYYMKHNNFVFCDSDIWKLLSLAIRKNKLDLLLNIVLIVDI